MFPIHRVDGRPRWKVIYDYIMDRQPLIGDLLAHGELRALLTIEEARDYYSIVSQASRNLEKNHSRTLLTIRNQGYQFSGGTGQIEKGRGYRNRSRRAITRSVQLVDTTDFGMMSAEDRSWADRERNAVRALLSIVKQHDEKLIAIDRQLHEVRHQTLESSLRQHATEEEMDRLRARVEELERERNPRA